MGDVQATGNGRVVVSLTRWDRHASSDVPVAVVSEGSRGLGLEVVRRLAGQGMRVVLASTSVASGRAAIELLGDLADRVAVRQLDVTDQGSVANLASWLRRMLGRCDVLVTNPVALEDDLDGVAADLHVVQRRLETDLVGVWRLIQAVVPLMRLRGHGRIVTVTQDRGGAANAVTASAAEALTRILADDLAADGILVNICRSGPDDTGADVVVRLATLPDNGPTGGANPRSGAPPPHDV